MKKLIGLMMSLLLGCACKPNTHEPQPPIVDYASYSYFIWINESDHLITLTGGRNGPIHDFTGKVIQPGESLEKESGWFGSPLLPSEYTPVMVVVFDDGAYQAIYGRYEAPFPDGYDRKYDLTWTENYVEENVDSPNGCEPCRGTRWTYTFTNADYEAAVRMSEAATE